MTSDAGAGAESWSVRAAAGRRLAADAEVPEVAVLLGRLLLDPYDTFVTRETAEALLLRGDATGLRLVLAALARADAQTGDQIQSAIVNVCEQSREDIEHLAELAATLVSDPDAGVREEARGLLGPGR
ncbi:HEAT repeat domain-containing protein [Streptomyces sp. AC154]|uniref:HEAT repeat domain-containing protein n=1 Tax=Streptomyces sp. AC154 TaxID=3143184 RepID=UPI003F7E9F63